MLKFLLSTTVTVAFFYVGAQSGEAIIAELRAANMNVVQKSCSAGDAAAITNRAMNVFMADKTSYLSESGDLSFYTNYITFNSIEGRLTVNHNFQKATGRDQPIKKLVIAGISINAADEITPPLLDKRFEKEAGLLLGYKWLGKVKTRFSDCTEAARKSLQKLSMDALRAGLLSTLQFDLHNQETAFLESLKTIDSTDVPGQNLDSVSANLLRIFYENLREEYVETFAKQQAEILTKTRNYKTISMGWTSLSSYIPVVASVYTVASTVRVPFQQKRSYPLAITLNHTRLWESTKTGRWFLNLSGNAFINNSKRSYNLTKINLSQYQSMGGTDTLYTTELKNDNAYIGDYRNFITPSLQVRLVYFPPANSHVGISLKLEQHFGRYHFLNGKIGIPIVLINSKKLPAINIEFYAQFFDMSNQMTIDNMHNNKLIGVSLGSPFSRLMY